MRAVPSASRTTIVAGRPPTRPRRRSATGPPGPSRCAVCTSMPVPTSGASGCEQRHRLALHVRSPSGRGWRRRAPGTGSAPPPRSRSASATRPCSRPGPAPPPGTARRARTETWSSTNVPSALRRTLAWAIDVALLLVGRAGSRSRPTRTGTMSTPSASWLAERGQLVGQLRVDLRVLGLGHHLAGRRVRRPVAQRRGPSVSSASFSTVVQHVAVRRLDEAVVVDLAVGRQASR